MSELFETERTAPRGEVARLLHALADGVDAGTVTVGDGGEALDVAVPEELEYELEIETEDDEGDVAVELEVELEWPAGPERDVAVPERDSRDGDEPDGTGDETVESAGEGSDEGEPEPGSVERAEDDVDEVVQESVGESERGADGETQARVASTSAIPVRPPELPESAARFELFTDRAGEWRWRLVHRNGNVIADSGEGYARKIDSRNGLESVRTNAPAAEIREVARED